MKWDVLNKKGSVIKAIELPAEIYSVAMNEAVLHKVVKAHRANKRQGTHATKTRSEVSGGGKKPFKQKGTGSARQGSSRSPLMPGGATSHGPQPRDYSEGVNKKIKKLALKVVLSDKVAHNKLYILDQFGLDSYKTKNVIDLMNAITASKSKTVLLVDEHKNNYLIKSAGNIKGTKIISPYDLSAVDLLGSEGLVLSETAFNVITSRLGEQSNESV